MSKGELQKMGRKAANNWNPIESVPSMEDLQFQSPAWYHRYASQTASRHLSPESYRNYFSDKTLSWELASRIGGAMEILLREDDDSVC